MSSTAPPRSRRTWWYSPLPCAASTSSIIARAGPSRPRPPRSRSRAEGDAEQVLRPGVHQHGPGPDVQHDHPVAHRVDELARQRALVVELGEVGLALGHQPALARRRARPRRAGPRERTAWPGSRRRRGEPPRPWPRRWRAPRRPPPPCGRPRAPWRSGSPGSRRRRASSGRPGRRRTAGRRAGRVRLRRRRRCRPRGPRARGCAASPPACPPRRRRPAASRRALRRLADGDLEARPAAGPVRRRDRAAVHLDDAVADREPQPRATAHGLGGDERREELRAAGPRRCPGPCPSPGP